MKRGLAVLLVALALPGAADAARYAVGVAPGANRTAVAYAIESRTGGKVGPLAPFAVALEAKSAAGVVGLPGVAYVERLGARGRRLSFVPNDPLAVKQWHLAAVKAFDPWAQRFTLPGLRVAIVDSGIDGGHPELAGRVAAHRSFVGGSALRDANGHGTFVAGLIAASVNNGQGIAGMAFPAQLLVAKVVRSDGIVPLEAEARAIRWAVDRGASVINLSLGGVRDPFDPARDSFSPLEASAIEYAIRKDVVVVAAVGNGDQAPELPWRYASYPAALPHVLGVSAVARDGGVPMFSNRDPQYNDIAAPGDELFSTLPRSLTALRPQCLEQGYSDCGPLEYRRPQGTSFATAIVSAGAVLVRAAWPNLRASQIVGLIERSATDMTPLTGCRRCTTDRDSLSGWGRLDVAAAVDFTGRLPALDRFEPNDDAGSRSYRIRRRTSGRRASLDFWNDPNDIYAIRLRRNGRLAVTLSGKTSNVNVNLYLWRPGTRRIANARSLTRVVDRSAGPESLEFVNFRARQRPGVYFVQVRIMEPGSTGYTLRVVRR